VKNEAAPASAAGAASIWEEQRLRISEINPELLNDEQITRLVFGNQPYQDQSGDCIFVFGGLVRDRTARAVALYMAGRAPRILFSGGTKWGQRNPAEALVMRDEALAMGVPPQDVLVECDSNHTVENVLASLLVLHRSVGLHTIRRLLAVSVPYHMRRCTLALKTYLPQWVEVIWCPVDRAECQVDNWWHTPEEAKRVVAEAHKVVSYVTAGIIQDDEVAL
jgi:hypothetical protein